MGSSICRSASDSEHSLTTADENERGDTGRHPIAPTSDVGATTSDRESSPASTNSSSRRPRARGSSKITASAIHSAAGGAMTPVTPGGGGSLFRSLSDRFGLAKGPDMSDLKSAYPFVSAGHFVRAISRFFTLSSEQLGDGASCKVVRATPKEAFVVDGGGGLGARQYALKIMARDDKYNPLLFKQEATILMQLKGHRNIIDFEDAFIDKKNFYILTTLLTGGELFDRVKAEKSFTETVAIEMIRHILSAVVHCHERNIVHRDLKPENIVFKTREYAPADLVIIDFGDAEEITDDSVHENFIGSPFYISPESIRARYGWELKKSDVWSVGVITYILLTGRPPFWAHTNKQILKKIVKSEVRFPPTVTLTALAKEFILALLQKDPGKRPSALEALNHDWINQSLDESLTVSTSEEKSSSERLKHDMRKAASAKRKKKGEAEKRRLEAFMENERILRDLASYHSSTKMKRLIIKTVASNLDASHREQYKMQFAPFDLKGDSRIDRSELCDFLVNCGCARDEATLRAAHVCWSVMGHIDRRITPDHWIYAQMGKLLAPAHICERQFQHLDIDSDELITASDLLQMFDGITLEQATEMIEEADCDGDGVINFEDFKKVMVFEGAYKAEDMTDSDRRKIREMIRRAERKAKTRKTADGKRSSAAAADHSPHSKEPTPSAGL